MKGMVKWNDPFLTVTAGWDPATALGPAVLGPPRHFPRDLGLGRGLVSVLGYTKATCRLRLCWGLQENRACGQREPVQAAWVP